MLFHAKRARQQVFDDIEADNATRGKHQWDYQQLCEAFYATTAPPLTKGAATVLSNEDATATRSRTTFLTMPTYNLHATA